MLLRYSFIGDARTSGHDPSPSLSQFEAVAALQEWFHLHASAVEAAERRLGSTDVTVRDNV